MKQIAFYLFTFLFATWAFAQEAEEDSLGLDDELDLEEVVVVGGGIIDIAEDRATPIAVNTILKEEIQQRLQGNTDFVDVIKYTPSVTIDNGGGGFGDAAAYVRGFDDRNTAYLLNGQPINGMEDGQMYWSNWAGMAEIANAVQIQRGLGSSKLAISSVGGTVNIVTKATERKKGGTAQFVVGNDSYVKGMVSYNTGLQGKWGFSVALSHWQAYRNYFEGTFGQGQNYFMSVGYKPNDDHQFNFLIFGAPQIHGQRWSQSLSRIDENSRFNQHWGYTSDLNDATGQYTSGIESERTNFYHKPVANLNWDWNISDDTNLSTVLYGSWGRGGGSGPRGNGRVRTDAGRLDYRGIEQQNVNAVSGGPRDGVYIRRGSMNNHQWYGLVSNLNHEFNDNLSLNVGFDGRMYRGDHFRQILDLYGLTEWTGDRPDGAAISQTFDINPWAMVFDFADEDERINYDFSENINYAGVFGQLEYKTDRFSAFFQGAVSNQSYIREDRFARDDAGNQTTVESDLENKIGYNVKGGASYAINQYNKVFGNAGFYSRQPFLDNIFAGSPTEFQTPEVDNEEITGLELGYGYSKGKVNVNVNLYHTEWANRYFDFGDEVETGIPDQTEDRRYEFTNLSQVHRGVEVDWNVKPMRRWMVRGFISFGDWEYAGSTPYRTRGDDFEYIEGIDPLTGLAGVGEVSLDGVKVSQAAQFSASLGTQFEVFKNFSIDADVRYQARNYQFVDIGDLIESSLNGQDYSTSALPAWALVDAGFTYQFKLGNQKIRFRGNVNNLFNESVILNSDAFGFFNSRGRTWNAAINLNF